MRYVSLLIGIGMLAGCSPSLADVPAPSTQPTGFAVVELFTSEGCSSCPPADEVLGKLVAQRSKYATNVFALAFHVDYWDRIGWKDRFSDPAFSRRQRDYANAAKSRQVYTPQMIVNGKPEGFVGSEEQTAKSEVAAALARPSTAQVALRPELTGRDLRLSYSIAGDTEGAVLCVAVVERELTTQVPRGENAGRNLVHQNVVRLFREVDLTKTSATLALTLPGDLMIQNGSVIAFVQDTKSRRIRGAAEAKLKAGESDSRQETSK